MFKNLIVFSDKKDFISALSFYVFWFIGVLLGAALVGYLGALALTHFAPEHVPAFAVWAGKGVAAVISLTLVVLIARSKNFLSDPASLALIVCTGVLAILAGGLGGLLIPAYFTTRESRTQG